MYEFSNISDMDIYNQYIKRIVPVSVRKLNQVAYYVHEVFRDLYNDNSYNYMISNFGRLYSKKNNIIVLPHINKKSGASEYQINQGGRILNCVSYELIMQTFAYRPDYIPGCKFFVKHINGNRAQSVYCPGHPLHNLEWSDNPGYLQYIINLLPKDYNEEFRPFPFDSRYIISNKGKVYSLIKDKFLTQILNKDGYYRVKLTEQKVYSIHRLVMITFAYRPDYASLVVNHIDGNKSNNVYYGEGYPETNLEWCTSQENTSHAVEHNLTCYGEEHGSSIFTDKFIETVCAAINENPHATSTEIAAKLNIEQSLQFTSLVTQLRCGGRWRRIAEKYPNICRVGKASKFTEPFVRQVCQVINENPRMTAPKIAEVLSIDPTNSFIDLVYSLRNGVSWLRITKDYPNIVRRYTSRNKQMKEV